MTVNVYWVTVTVHVALALGLSIEVAVIVAVPTLWAVTEAVSFPFVFTVATLELLVDQLTRVLEAPEGVNVAVRLCAGCPRIIDNDEELSPRLVTAT
jgi:hypothetical protein